MRPFQVVSLIATVLITVAPLVAVEQASVPAAINALGLDLYREQIKTASGRSVLLSPYSIATALAMTYAGADGDTKTEMARALHFPADSAACNESFANMDAQLDRLFAGAPSSNESSPTLNIANRLFVQRGFKLRPQFQAELSREFGAVAGETDFKTNPDGARREINQWVARATRDRIKDLLPIGQPTRDTRLALVNALYLKAAWREPFREHNTQPEEFHVAAGKLESVPTMTRNDDFGYAKRDGYTVVTISYETGSLQFVLFVPDDIDGLAQLEQKLTENDLTDCKRLPQRAVFLHLPKFKLEPATMALGDALKALGLKTAFDEPRGSANFDRMAPRHPDEYLAISDVFHKTWLSLDEHGTEAAAATAAIAAATFAISEGQPPLPVVVRADRPFLFAIQHVDSGACLFLGRVTDPR